MKNRNHFQTLPAGALKLKGELGKMQLLCIENLVKRTNWAGLVVPFRERYETNSWRGEFWGKMIRGAILLAYTTQDAELKKLIKETVYDIISTQDENGCITAVAEKNQPGLWEVWGRKYVLMGLTRYCQYIEKDPVVVDACRREVDHLMEQLGPNGWDPLKTGYHSGLATCSIIGAIVRVYRLTGDRKYLDYAKYLVKTGCYGGGDIFQGVLEGKTPADLGNGKAYEMTSCFQGLGELCIEDDEFPQAYEILTRYYAAVRDREIACTGLGGGKDRFGEYWNDIALIQNSTDKSRTGAIGETCVTVTWLHYLERILQLTGDAKVFDQCELAFYNAMLGAMVPDGSNCTHWNPTPLNGPTYKIHSIDQMLIGFNRAFHGMDCCRAQAAEGLGLAGILAVMLQDNAPVFNLYEDMEVSLDGVKYTVEGGWPFKGDQAKITLSMDAPRKLALRFRVPERETGRSFAQVNGESFDATPGTYLTIDREWKDGDTVTLTFDQALRKRILPTTPNSFCYMEGPIVMAEDGRLNMYHGDTYSYRKVDTIGDKYICDYASAGSEFTDIHHFRVIFEKDEELGQLD